MLLIPFLKPVLVVRERIINCAQILIIRAAPELILHLGLLATALAYTLFGQGLRLTPLATAVTISLAEPLTAGILGVTLLGEKLTPLAGLGLALIFSGLLVLSVRKPG